MKLQLFAITAFILFLLIACRTTKKTVVEKPPVANTPVATNTVNTSTVAILPGITADPLAPGDKEVTAIKSIYPEVTATTLNEGYRIYSGPCIKCHNEAKMKLYTRSEESWKKAVDAMAPKARITDAEKDALWKYIVAMRASHSNGSK